VRPDRGSVRDLVRHRHVLPRFRDAFSGLRQAYREEPNLRFHLFAGTLVFVAGFCVGLDAWEKAYLAATVAAVLLAEMVNTAVERAVDFAAAGRRHPLAGQAKEIAAGAVLLAALHALFAAGFVFLYNRALVVTLNAVIDGVAEHPWLVLLPLAAAIAGLVGGDRGST